MFSTYQLEKSAELGVLSEELFFPHLPHLPTPYSPLPKYAYYYLESSSRPFFS
jgi:hypothetical protein